MQHNNISNLSFCETQITNFRNCILTGLSVDRNHNITALREPSPANSLSSSQINQSINIGTE